MRNNEVLEQISRLEALAERISRNLMSRRRPLFVEFCGMPKSGKTTAVNSLSLFLRRNDIPTRVITERASVCPIPDKIHPFFNIWTACTTLSSILESVQTTSHSVVIADRGLYDSIMWLTLMRNLGRLDSKELERIADFLLLNFWRRHVDLVIYMHTTVQKALEREFKDQLTRKPGSVMNETILGKFINAAEHARRRYAPLFRGFEVIDTTDLPTADGVALITTAVLEALEALSDEELIVLPNSLINSVGLSGFCGEAAKFENLSKQVGRPNEKLRRSEAEVREDLVQPIASAVLQYRDTIMLVTRREPDARQRFHQRQAIWVGGHLRWEDVVDSKGPTLMEALKTCLRRELEEEICLRQPVDINYKGLCYDRSHPRSLRHLAVVFHAQVPKAVMESLNKKAYREPAGQELYLEFVPIDQRVIEQSVRSVEPWSADILKALYGIVVPTAARGEQLLLF